MKSVGETMAIGRTFKEAFQKALRGLEVGSFGFGCDGKDLWGTPRATDARRYPGQVGRAQRRPRVVFAVRDSRDGMSVEEIYEMTPDRSLVSRRTAADCRTGRRAPAAVRYGRGVRRIVSPGEAIRFFRSAVGRGVERHGNGSAGRSVAAENCRRRSNRSIPAPPSSKPTRRTTIPPTKTKTKCRQAGRRQADRHSRRRAEPDRAGHRVRLLLLPCQLRFARAGHRKRDGQLESRDREHRLRHQRFAVLRAADGGRRAEHLRPRSTRRRDRAIWRPDAAEFGAAPCPAPACR